MCLKQRIPLLFRLCSLLFRPRQLISKSLKTKVLAVAKQRLPDEKKKHLEIHEKRKALVTGRWWSEM